MKRFIYTVLLIILIPFNVKSSIAMQNIPARDKISLNGVWNILVDLYDVGTDNKWYIVNNETNTRLSELCYDGNITLKVPGDWNHQYPEFDYYEGNIWYYKELYLKPDLTKRAFIHFSAVSTDCSVYINGELLGHHHGGFTPFQFEITNKIKEGRNYIVVRVDNKRTKETIPSVKFDWWNYGGITRDVDIVYVPTTYINDYFIRIDKNNPKNLLATIKLDGKEAKNSMININIGNGKLKFSLKTDGTGTAHLSTNVKLNLWEPTNPYLYDICISSSLDTIVDRIGFRTIKVENNKLLLNGKNLYLRGINFHEEIPYEKRRAYSIDDSKFLINQAIQLGCNFIRLAHYPQSEYTVRLAEEKGILLWEEIPIWQNINFESEKVCRNATLMATEMVQRDKNRCGIIIWSISNETSNTDKSRNTFLPKLAQRIRNIDSSRLISSALDKAQPVKGKDGSYTMILNDPLIKHLDIVGYNKYLGWYQPFPCDAEKLKWDVIEVKPIIMSEFGAECLQGNDIGDVTNVNSWTETYMSEVYRKDLISFENSASIVGISPWILFDFRVPMRAHSKFQKGWNRKGLISPEYKRKQVWYIMKEFYGRKSRYY